MREVKAIEGGGNYLAFSKDGSRLVAAGGGITVWNPSNWQVLKRCGPKFVESFSLVPDGKRALISTAPSTWELWNLDEGILIRPLVGHEPTMNTVIAASPNGRLGASACGLAQRYTKEAPGDFAIRIWDMETGECLRRLEGHVAPVGGLLFLPDGQRLLSGSADHTLRLWNVETGEELRRDGEPTPLQWEEAIINGKRTEFTLYQHHRGAFALSHDGRCVLRGRQLWDVENWQPLRFLGGEQQGFENWNCGAFSPDGHRILTGHSNGYLRLWDAKTGQEICHTFAFKNHAAVLAVAFLPDGKQAISGGSGYAEGIAPPNGIRQDPYMRIWALPE